MFVCMSTLFQSFIYVIIITYVYIHCICGHTYVMGLYVVTALYRLTDIHVYILARYFVCFNSNTSLGWYLLQHAAFGSLDLYLDEILIIRAES